MANRSSFDYWLSNYIENDRVRFGIWIGLTLCVVATSFFILSREWYNVFVAKHAGEFFYAVSIVLSLVSASYGYRSAWGEDLVVILGFFFMFLLFSIIGATPQSEFVTPRDNRIGFAAIVWALPNWIVSFNVGELLREKRLTLTATISIWGIGMYLLVYFLAI